MAGRSLAFRPRSPDIGTGGWRWTSHSPTGSDPEGSSPNEHGSGRSSASHYFRSKRTAQPARPPVGWHDERNRETQRSRPGPRRRARGAGYRVLARKYRPASFDDLIGQDAMVRTISNAFESGRIPQAWILTGVRGVGKTTTARILARALNYELPDGSVTGPTINMPVMGVHCQAIIESRHIDVLEMDAASHNSASRTCARSTTPSATRRCRRATKSTSSTKCTCCRARRSTRCSRRWKSRRRTPNSSSPPPKSARCR